MKNFDEDKENMSSAFDQFRTMTSYPFEITLKEAFEAGYNAALFDKEGDWQDGYEHGYDEGRYKSIEEGF